MQTAKSTAAIVAVAALALSGCGLSFRLDRVTAGPMQTEQVNVPMPEDRSSVWDVELSPGAATVKITSGGEALVHGAIAYNASPLRPQVDVAGRSVRINQGEIRGTLASDVRNDWDLQLGAGLPMNLKINTGATKGTFELGGLSLRQLELNIGAAESSVRFSQPNLERMSQFTLNGGAASINLTGLGNLNLDTGRIVAGAGSFKLSFDGQLNRDAHITLEGGVSSVDIDSGGNPVEVVVAEKALSSVNAGEWARSGNTYRSPEAASATGPKIVIEVKLGLGSLTLLSAR